MTITHLPPCSESYKWLDSILSLAQQFFNFKLNILNDIKPWEATTRCFSLPDWDEVAVIKVTGHGLPAILMCGLSEQGWIFYIKFTNTDSETLENKDLFPNKIILTCKMLEIANTLNSVKNDK